VGDEVGEDEMNAEAQRRGGGERGGILRVGWNPGCVHPGLMMGFWSFERCVAYYGHWCDGVGVFSVQGGAAHFGEDGHVEEMHAA
jgi:hypothetical protein